MTELVGGDRDPRRGEQGCGGEDEHGRAGAVEHALRKRIRHGRFHEATLLRGVGRRLRIEPPGGDGVYARGVILLVVLAGGLVLGAAARFLLPGRSRLSLSATTVVGIAGAGIGLTLAELLGGRTALRVGLALGCTVVLLAAVTLVERRRAPAPTGTLELVAAGESGRVEFKTTARRNVHTGEKDARIELVIAKSIAGLLNAEGGTLLVGVADDGAIVGVETDYALCGKPDRDGFELWLRDFLAGRLGTGALADIRLSFETIEGRDVCRVDVAPATTPVFLAEPGGGRTADLYVRMGNATRKLLTDEALAYAQRRFA